MKISKTEREKAIAQMREWLKPGDTVYTVLRHVSRSGMQREIGLVIKSGDRMLHPNYSASIITGYRQGKRDGIIIGGCGMDMGFALVYDLSRSLFPDGFGIEAEPNPSGDTLRPTTKARAERMRKDGWKFQGRNGDTSGWDDDGGYALKQVWL